MSRLLALVLLLTVAGSTNAAAQRTKVPRESCAFYEDAARRLGDPTLRKPAGDCLDLSIREWRDALSARRPDDPPLSGPGSLARFDFCTTLSYSGLCRPAKPAEYLYVWAGASRPEDPDFLAVIDVRDDSPSYGTVIATVPVEGQMNVPHHTEYEMAATTLLASGWGKGRTFIFDLTSPASPAVVGDFTTRGDYGYPHSYARLPNGNVLAVFQSRGAEYEGPGGLVELSATGELIRASSAATSEIPAEEIWPYSLLVLPHIDRVVTTNTRMGTVEEWIAGAEAKRQGHVHTAPDPDTRHLQLWRLSDLTLLGSFELPAQSGGHNLWPAEPRQLANGEVYVNTFSCGLYRLVGLDGDRPRAEPAGFSSRDGPGYCAVPVVIDDFWIYPSTPERAVIAIDLRDPAAPRESSRITLDQRFHDPHWLAVDRSSNRIVVTSEEGWVLLLDFDDETGRLSINDRFRDPGADHPGVSFRRPSWPHGTSAPARPHGAVFR